MVNAAQIYQYIQEIRARLSKLAVTIGLEPQVLADAFYKPKNTPEELRAYLAGCTPAVLGNNYFHTRFACFIEAAARGLAELESLRAAIGTHVAALKRGVLPPGTMKQVRDAQLKTIKTAERAQTLLTIGVSAWGRVLEGARQLAAQGATLREGIGTVDESLRAKLFEEDEERWRESVSRIAIPAVDSVLNLVKIGRNYAEVMAKGVESTYESQRNALVGWQQTIQNWEATMGEDKGVLSSFAEFFFGKAGLKGLFIGVVLVGGIVLLGGFVIGKARSLAAGEPIRRRRLPPVDDADDDEAA